MGATGSKNTFSEVLFEAHQIDKFLIDCELQFQKGMTRFGCFGRISIAFLGNDAHVGPNHDFRIEVPHGAGGFNGKCQHTLVRNARVFDFLARNSTGINDNQSFGSKDNHVPNSLEGNFDMFATLQQGRSFGSCERDGQ